MLKRLALHLLKHKETFYDQLGNRRNANDAWIDIEGGIGNLFSYASLRRQLATNPLPWTVTTFH